MDAILFTPVTQRFGIVLFFLQLKSSAQAH